MEATLKSNNTRRESGSGEDIETGSSLSQDHDAKNSDASANQSSQVTKRMSSIIEADGVFCSLGKLFICHSRRRQRDVIKDHPSILLITIVIFVVLCAAGLSLVFLLPQTGEERAQQEAFLLAIETGQWFSDQLDRALLPLFSLAQFVSELDIFHDLDMQIGDVGAPGAAPLIAPKYTHRNVTDICGNETLVSRYEHIASTIKKNAKMEGILVNLQLAPRAVVCLLHPIVNTEDFEEDGIIMDNTGALGHDLLSDPARKFAAEKTLASDDVIVVGPLTLRQCSDCHPTVKKAFIARLPIDMPGRSLDTSDGRSFSKWGFAVALINWERLVEKSGIYENFADRGMEFQLKRTDTIFNATTGTYNKNVVILAQTDDFDLDSERKHARFALQTTNDEWVITVGYDVNATEWRPWATAATILLSAFISVLVYFLLVQNQIHADLIAEKSAIKVEIARKSAQEQRDLNEYIAHEVRNPVSAAISACSFVSAAVNEKEPLVDPESRAAVKDDVKIIENSLQFVNDLLRNMLDMCRVSRNQLNTELVMTDVLHDVLQPVASMLYHRDTCFEVEVDCQPENLIIMTDRLRLKQVIMNLGRNACKFVEKGFIRLKARVVEGEVHIYVEDSGPGIPLDKQKRLFAKFQESLDSLNQGTGVGLNLCQTMITHLGGDIWLDEDYNSGIPSCPGACFVVNLKKKPLTAADVSLLASGNGHCGDSIISEEGSSFSRKAAIADLPKDLSVLFVDDDLILRKLFCRIIKKALPTWTVKEAANGETALRMTATETFSVIFLDQYMSSVDKQLLGTETARALRAQGVESVICGLSANDLEESFISAGANAFMMKPFPCKEGELAKELVRILNV